MPRFAEGLTTANSNLTNHMRCFCAQASIVELLRKIVDKKNRQRVLNLECVGPAHRDRNISVSDLLNFCVQLLHAFNDLRHPVRAWWTRHAGDLDEDFRGASHTT